MNEDNHNYLKESSLYLSGITKMASCVSKKIGLSYMDADCFNRNNFIDAFSTYYEIPKESIKIHEINTTLDKLFITLLGNDKNLIDSLLHLINLEAGKLVKIYTTDKKSNVLDLLSRSGNGLAPFWFVEELYFVEFDKMVVSFMIGNDE